MRRSTRTAAIVLAGVQLLLLVGCGNATSSGQSIQSSPSQAYLQTPVRDGWTRAVERRDGLVLIFESPRIVTIDDALPGRFVLVNESDRDRHWGDAGFGTRLGETGAIGIPHSGYSPPRPVDLRSGESTTHDVTWRASDLAAPGGQTVVLQPGFGQSSSGSAIAEVPAFSVKVQP